MIPCNFCGEFCSPPCPEKAQHFFKKQAAFYAAYSGYTVTKNGNIVASKPGPVQKKPAVTEQSKPCTCLKDPYEWVKFCEAHGPGEAAIPEELKNFEGLYCPECGNHTWKKGWHFQGCKYHLAPSICPVPGHKDCVAAKKPLPQGGHALNILPQDGSLIAKNSWGGVTPMYSVEDEISDFPNDAAYVVGDLNSPNGVQKIEGIGMKYDHGLYMDQLFNFAAHHGVSRKIAWDQTLGKISAAKGYGWKNPYKDGGLVPSIESAGTPHWPLLMHVYDFSCAYGGTDCALCKEQAAGPTTSEFMKPSLKPLAKGVLGDYTALDVAVTKSLYEQAVKPDWWPGEYSQKPAPKDDPGTNILGAVKKATAAMQQFGANAEELKKKVKAAIQGLPDSEILKSVRTAYTGNSEADAEHYVSNMPDSVVDLLAYYEPEADKSVKTAAGVPCQCADCKTYNNNLALHEAAKNQQFKISVAEKAVPVTFEEMQAADPVFQVYKKSVGFETPVTLKALRDLIVEYMDSDAEDSEEFVSGLTKAQLFLLTGLKAGVVNSFVAVQKKAVELLDEWDDIPEYDEDKWTEAIFNKNHGKNPGPQKKNSLYSLYSSGGPVFFGDSANLKVTYDSIPDQMVNVGVVNASTTFETKNVSPETIAAMTGCKTEALKPGDQVIIQVSKAGTLLIPPGMEAVVIPK